MAETINRIAGLWFEWQWAMLWQTAVLIGLVAVIDRLIRKRAWPQLRYMLWLLVFVKLVLPPGLTSPWSVTSQVPALAQQAVEAGMQTPERPCRCSSDPTASGRAGSYNCDRNTTNTEPLAAALPPTRIRTEPTSSGKIRTFVLDGLCDGRLAGGRCGIGVGPAHPPAAVIEGACRSRPADVPAWFDELLDADRERDGIETTCRESSSARGSVVRRCLAYCDRFCSSRRTACPSHDRKPGTSCSTSWPTSNAATCSSTPATWSWRRSTGSIPCCG